MKNEKAIPLFASDKIKRKSDKFGIYLIKRGRAKCGLGRCQIRHDYVPNRRLPGPFLQLTG